MIKVEGISKRYKLYHSPADRLKEIFFRTSHHKDFAALDGISFEVGDQQTLGIIGENGAGKSTLLKILSGIVIPDSGTIKIDGKVTGLLELGTGFNLEMTGLENIYMNGTLIGMTKDEINWKKQDIIDFSELGDFIREPIKTYSSGMLMRLAFSIAIHADPKCFLVDEALSVGDAYFQQKCIRKIQEFRENGGSIIFVSHDMNSVMTICDYAILLEKGKMISYGIPKGVVDLYISRICQKAHQGPRKVVIKNSGSENDIHSNISTKEIDHISLQILDESGNPVTHVYSSDIATIKLAFRSLRLIKDPSFGILLRNRYGISIFGINTYLMKQKVDPIKPGEYYEVSFSLNIALQPDEYLITVAIDNKGVGINSFNEYLLRLNDIATMKVVRKENSLLYEGLTNLNPKFCMVSGSIPLVSGVEND